MLWRFVLFLLVLSGLVFAQAPAEACKERCSQAMMACLNPCANAKSAQTNLECIRTCRQKNQACLQDCK